MEWQEQYKKDHYQMEESKLTFKEKCRLAYYLDNLPPISEECDVCGGSGSNGDGICSKCNGDGKA